MDSISLRLQPGLGSRKLPPELALLVGQYCIREYAIAAVWLQIPGSITHSVDMLAGIWACYVKIDGTRYIASFANRPSGNAQLILSTEQATSVGTMYVAEDHLGIRQVYFGDSGPPNMDKRVSGLWWRTFFVYGGSRVRVYTDVGFTPPYQRSC